MVTKTFCDVCEKEIDGEYIFIPDCDFGRIYDTGDWNRDGYASVKHDTFCSLSCFIKELKEIAEEEE